MSEQQYTERDRWLESWGISPRFSYARQSRALYFIGAVNRITGMIDAVKIGVCRKNAPESRLEALQCGCPDELVLIAALDDVTTAIEAALHVRFKVFHIRGEWFRLEGDFLAFIQELVPSQGAAK